VAPDGSVFVADTWNHRIQKFSADGQFVKAWGQFGNAEMANGFYGPRQISIDASGRVYVADTGNNRIIIFDGEGNQLGVFGSVGLEAGQFYEPTGVAVGQDGRIYVADTWNQRIQVFEPSADFTSFPQVAEWPINGWFSQNIENKPQIAVDSNNHVFVTDPEGFRILEFDGTGKFITTWGGPGVTDNSFSQPSGVAVDSQGNIWVTDAGDNNRVMRFVLP
jgi:DNA-binding beta-propeller fold protein YncE